MHGQEVPHDRLLLRAARQGRSKVYIPDSINISPSVFDPRPNENGVSVDVATSRLPRDLIDQARTLSRTLNSCGGVFQLETLQVKTVDPDRRLGVIYFDQEDNPNHAHITGIPHDQSREAIALREYLTGLLARIATEVIDEAGNALKHRKT